MQTVKIPDRPGRQINLIKLIYSAICSDLCRLIRAFAGCICLEGTFSHCKAHTVLIKNKYTFLAMFLSTFIL